MGKRIIPKLATTNYYQEISPATEEVVDIGYKNHDLDWRVTFMTTPYNCNDLGYQATLATINYLQEKEQKIFVSIKKEQGFESLDNSYKKMVDTGAKLEEQFYDGDIPSEDQLDTLGNIYGNLYAKIVEDTRGGRAVDSIIKEYKDTFLRQNLLIEGRLADFDGVVSFFSYILDGYSQMSLFSNKKDNYLYLYTSRSGYPLLFSGFSPSVWRSEERLQLIDNTRPQLRTGLLDYQEMIARFGLVYTRKITELTREQVWYELLGHYVK